MAILPPKKTTQNAVCGGGRYDNLVETLGGQHTPAIGWAVGMERLYSLTEKSEPEKIDYFVISDNIAEALKLANEIRNTGKKADFDYSKRKFVKQIEKASKVAKNAVIIGETELSAGTVSVKNLETFEQINISRVDFLKQISC